MSTWKIIIISFVVATITFLLGFILRGCTNTPSVPEPVIVRDTLIVNDSIYIQGRTRILSVRDTLYLTKPDTANHSVDTTEMLVYAQKEYRDTFATDSSKIELGVKFSGYNAKIDSIDLNYYFKIEPQVIEKKNGWGWSVIVGPYVGYGGTVVNNQVFLAPEIGIGVSVGFGYHWRK